jgi:hypothetical protein
LFDTKSVTDLRVGQRLDQRINGSYFCTIQPEPDGGWFVTFTDAPCNSHMMDGFGNSFDAGLIYVFPNEDTQSILFKQDGSLDYAAIDEAIKLKSLNPSLSWRERMIKYGTKNDPSAESFILRLEKAIVSSDSQTALSHHEDAPQEPVGYKQQSLRGMNRLVDWVNSLVGVK